MQPWDRYNQALVAQVHPADWVNPPGGAYDLVVIGGGTAGLVTAGGAAGLGVGLRVALIEKHLLGGDCLNVGCVPSKSLIRSARAIADLHKMQQFGVQVDHWQVDFVAVMERLRQVRSQISPHDAAERFRQEFGVDVFFGTARFISRDRLEVEGVPLQFRKAVIATGSQAFIPPIPGLETADYLTNATVFSLTERPARLAVIGGGAIGCELAQAFQLLGSEVTLLHKHSRLLPQDDPEAAQLLQQVFEQQGMRLLFNAEITQVETQAQEKILQVQTPQGASRLTVDAILVAAGRRPHLEDLHLQRAGVMFDHRQGVSVNDYLQTSNPRIFAVGDCCMRWKYTHAADAAARIVIRNAMFAPFGIGRQRLSRLLMPHTTYTTPEIAQVGLTQSEAQAQGINAVSLNVPLQEIDRAMIDDATIGFVKILHRPGSDQILGATLVADHAGELISEITLAIANKLGLTKLSQVIHPYPTQAEVIKKVADTYMLRQLSAGWNQTLLRWLTKF